LTTSHPLLATTIEGATSVYTSSKNFSPRFKSGAEYVEGYLTPIANTVGSVSRVTGVEGGVRWFLGGNNRRPHSSSSDLEAGRGNKRRKITAPSGSGPSTPAIQNGLASPAPVADPYAFTKERRTSMSTVDTLPAYDDVRSPAYEATDEPSGDRTPTAERPSTSSSSSAWQSRLIMSTSGLSIAMSEESLRSLKYCLQWLRWANDHIAGVVDTLKTTIDKYDVKPDTSEHPVTSTSTEASSEKQNQPATAAANASSDASVAPPPQASEAEVANSIAAMRNDVLKTLRDVVETVSKYAGGALPENARILVRKHLTSLPQRFRLANQAEVGPSSSTTANGNGVGDAAHSEKGQHEKNKEIRDGAQRVMVLAKEGLDMMTQVSGVLDGTIVSAEEWCERLGRKKREQRETLLGGASNGEGSGATPPEPAVLAGVTVDGDTKMG
jgi:transcriptional repressor OPI1